MSKRTSLADLATEILGGPDVCDDTGELFRRLYPGFEFKKIGFRKNLVSIDLHSTSTTACCPKCGMETTVIHDHPTRTLQDIRPGIGIMLVRLTLHQFVCNNPNCAVKMFRESISFAEPD